MRILRLLGALLLAFVVVGCKAPPGKIKFNDRMAWDARDLQRMGREFRKAADESASAAQSKLTAIEKALKEMKEYHADAMVPINSNSAQALQDAFREFLEAESKVTAKMRDVVGQLQNKQPVNWSDVSGAESAALQKLKNAQKAFFDEHYFRGVEKYPQQ
jgi:hypothetical protein